MRIFVKTHPKAKRAKIIKRDASHYEIWVTEAPEDGRANRAVLDALSETLGVATSTMAFISGQTSRSKVIELQTMC